MWRKKDGDCGCYFCLEGKEHPQYHQKYMEGRGSYLQVAESLDPHDIIHTRICTLCAHEVKAE